MKLLPLIICLLILFSCQEKLMDRFERETAEFTIRNCPKQIDVITTLDSLVFHNDGSLDYKYYYTVNLTDEQRAEFIRQRNVIEENTLKALRNSIDMKAVKDAGLNVEYRYYDAENHKCIIKFRFTKEQYQ